MAYPISQFGMTFRDYDEEMSSLSVFLPTINAGNIAATQTAANALSSAIQALSIGRLASHRMIAYNTVDSALPAATKPAQRETKWLVNYHDTSGKKFQVEIPCADTQFLAENSEYIDETATEWTDFKTAFEAVVVSPGDSSAVTVDSAILVGRRS